MEYFSKRGYYCVFIKYSGTWESEGRFLKDSPVKDVLKVVARINKDRGLTSLYDGAFIKFNYEEIVLFGSSFGGSVSLVATSKSKLVGKTVALCPVVNFEKHNNVKEQDLLHLGKFVRKAYGRSYLYDMDAWKALLKGKLDLNPSDNMQGLEEKRVLIVQGKNDKSVSSEKVFRFYNKIPSGSKKIIFLPDDHISFSSLKVGALKKIESFIKD